MNANTAETKVHAKGAGAHGSFEVTHDLSDITSQTLFHHVGETVDATVRFSTVAGELGSADTARDVHGFAIKLKTEQGILDWVFLNTPTFFIRDPGKYADLVHATKRNPQTNLKDHDTFWASFRHSVTENWSLTHSAGFFLPKSGDHSPSHDSLLLPWNS